MHPDTRTQTVVCYGVSQITTLPWEQIELLRGQFEVKKDPNVKICITLLKKKEKEKRKEEWNMK